MNRTKRKDNQIKKSLFEAIATDNIEQFNEIVKNHFTNNNAGKIDRNKIKSLVFKDKSLIDTVIFHDRLLILKELVENAGIDPMIKDEQIGTTPLHYSVILGAKECMEYLLDHAIDKRIDISKMRDDIGFTPLHWAASSTYNKVDKIIEILLSFGVDIDARDNQQRTPLHIAILKGLSENVKLSLDSGADPTAIDELGSTPLHYAAAFGHPSIVNLLLNNKVDVSARDCRGFTPLDLARKNNFPDHKIVISLIIGATKEYNPTYGTQLEDDNLQEVSNPLNEEFVIINNVLPVDPIGADTIEVLCAEFNIL